MIGDVFEQQRRAELARNFARDRAELLVPVDLCADALQISSVLPRSSIQSRKSSKATENKPPSANSCFYEPSSLRATAAAGSRIL